jgi:hypothetical protein
MAFYNKHIKICCNGPSTEHTGRGLPCNLTSTPVTFQVASSSRPSNTPWHRPQLRLFAIVRQRNETTENGVWGRKSTKKYHSRAATKLLGGLILSACLNQADNQPGSTAIRHAISFSATGCSRKDYVNLCIFFWQGYLFHVGILA